jgi:SAM-dependent methyltransferase
VDELRISDDVQALLRCPACGGNLSRHTDGFSCATAGCGSRFPVVHGVPVLLDEARSVFRASEITSPGKRTPDLKVNRGRLLLLRLGLSISANPRANRNFARLGTLLAERSPAPKVLVIGGGLAGRGIQALLRSPTLQLVETDVAFGPRTAMICDAHALPFANESFDGVVAQAVLEHVVDPYRCVEEMHRVLRPHGLAYAETPFMQQVHMGRFDFTRFTHLGHRRLFRRFDEIDSGAASGPATALVWSIRHFLLSWFRGRLARTVVKTVASLTTFWLKYFDYILIARPGALDAASGVYFLGRKSDRILSDRDLLELYRGAM